MKRSGTSHGQHQKGKMIPDQQAETKPGTDWKLAVSKVPDHVRKMRLVDEPRSVPKQMNR